MSCRLLALCRGGGGGGATRSIYTSSSSSSRSRPWARLSLVLPPRSPVALAALPPTPPSLAVGVTKSTTSRLFASPSAAAAAEEEEEPIIPGIGKGKTSTGIVGLAVQPDWYNVIQDKFQRLLDAMAASDMPETAQYRIDVTKWANFVLRTVQDHPNDPEAVEDAVQMGQVEELIEMADDEMIALQAYLEVRMWELAEAANPAVLYDHDPMKDEMAEGGNPDVQEKIRESLEKMKEVKKE